MPALQQPRCAAATAFALVAVACAVFAAVAVAQQHGGVATSEAAGSTTTLLAKLLGAGNGLLSGDGSSTKLPEWLSYGRGLAKTKAQVLAELRDENDWKNDLLLSWWMPAEWRDALPRPVQTWVRNYIVSIFIYFSVAGAWSYYVYFAFGDRLFEPGKTPAVWDVLEQIKVSNFALPLYSALPVFNEWVAEQGWTRAYARVADVGLPLYCVYFVLYMALVEYGVYWAHRGLHEWQWGMRNIHWTHHTYNKENTLSPFAGLAFSPIDGCIQAFPYTLAMLAVPMHFMTHELLLFFTAVWTTNIHDCIHADVKPVMGAGYHTIHHTTYKHNYGQFFTFMDRLHGTLVTPEEYEAARNAK